ncbi:hypothetical protein C8046_10030 [Serinibacter arcticus]|uniref:Alternate-type signal peptide domain-containing protein n=1 Tax=Serinibacter arcticus TaxID=1655435 RepID=A0A2U1ZVH0_9MICO|nr:alternate-type signal peptide domain-containing protein [Serinibacter arcticus]PWD50940.1 hypothetical protein C8046_10030 [Serinibacter arcticus]
MSRHTQPEGVDAGTSVDAATGAPPSRRRWVRPAVAGVTLLVGLGVGGSGTFALWGDAPGAVAAGTIRTGDLDVSLVGTPVWSLTATDVAGTPTTIDPSTFLVRPGDSFTITQGATALIRGDNLNATFAVTFPGVSLPAGATASYTVLDGGTTLGSAAVGSPVTIAPLVGSNAGVTRNLTVRTTLTFPTSIADQVRTPGNAAAGAAVNLGALTVTLQQVRTGEGF